VESIVPPDIAIAFVLAAPCTAVAGGKKDTIEVNSFNFGTGGSTARDPQSGLPTGKRMHKPPTVTTPVGSASPALTTQNKPLTTTVNPALQENVLQKGTVGGSTGPTKHIEAITVKQK
jgi:hypothetical protein